MNSFHAIGRVGADAELHYTNGGVPVASFSLALDNGKDKEGQKRPPTWIKAVLWEKKAESLAQYVTKGKCVSVVGSVSAEAWNDKQSGDAKAKIVVNVRDFEFCGGSKEENSNGNGSAAHGDETDQRRPEPQAAQPISDEDIPF